MSKTLEEFGANEDIGGIKILKCLEELGGMEYFEDLQVSKTLKGLDVRILRLMINTIIKALETTKEN